MKFKDFPQAVIDENVDYTVKEITNVIKRYGPRESGNKNCLATQKHIDKEMKPFCDETGFESYKMAKHLWLSSSMNLAYAASSIVRSPSLQVSSFINLQSEGSALYLYVSCACSFCNLVISVSILFISIFFDNVAN